MAVEPQRLIVFVPVTTDPLTGDETYMGGVEPGLLGGRAKGNKALVAIAVEMRGEYRLGRSRLQAVPDAAGETLQAFVKDHVEPGSTVVTDGWPSYPGLVKLNYKHEARNQSAAKARGEDPSELLKGVHRIASLAKRWLLGTHQGAVKNSHLPAYLMSFRLGSTGAVLAAEGCCSSGHSSSLSSTNPCATTI